MKLFRQLLGKKAEPESLESKILKLDQQTQSSLETMVSGASAESQELGFRVAVVERLAYGDVLQKLATNGDGAAPAEIEKAARTRVAALLDSGELSVDVILTQIKTPEVLLAISGFCQKVDLETQALSSIDDEALLAKLCQAATSSSVRQSLAGRIESSALLKELAKSLKTKDKKAYRIVKTKLDAKKEEENKEAEKAQKLIHLCEEMEQQVSRHVDKDYLLRHDRLLRRWQEAIDSDNGAQPADATMNTRFNTALTSCEQLIRSYEDEQKAAQAHEEKLLGLESDRKAVLEALWQLIDRIYTMPNVDASQVDEVKAGHEAIKTKWAELKQLGKPDNSSLKQYTVMGDAVETLLNLYAQEGTLAETRQRVETADLEQQREGIKQLRRLLYPTQSLSDLKPWPSVSETLALMKNLDADFANFKETQAKQTRALGGLIRKANQAVEQGRLRQAIGIRHSIDEKMATIDTVPGHITRQLESLDEAVQKLVDWQAYAVVPKKEGLIEAMGALVGADITPEALATKIKKLQDEWRLLNQSGKDRNEELWQKFSELADKAYEPCKAYYQELAEIRKKNIDKRLALVKQLEDFYKEYGWEEADWKYVEQIIKTARSELHSYVPVERAANKGVMESFDAAIAAIQAKLDEEFAKNKAAKEQLIHQASKLSELADLQQSIDSAKRLQMQWKKIGRCHYRDNDKLWKAFRVHCDEVFNKKEKADSEKRAEVDGIIQQGREMVDKMKALLALDGDALLGARSERDELQSQLNALEGLPEKVERALQRDLGQAGERFDEKVTACLNNNEKDAWNALFSANEQANQYLLASQAADDSHREAAKVELDTYIDGVSQWPEGGKALLTQKIEDESATTIQCDQNAKALKLLCIRAEICADKESPAEDKALRMEYQVSILQQGMGQNYRDDTPASLAREWVKIGPVIEGDYQGLYQRFMTSWSTLSS